MMKRSASFFASTALIASLLGGCATVVGGTAQNVDVQLIGAEKARCTISNESYKYLVNAPAVVPIEKSYKDMTVECYGTGGKYAKFTMESMASGDTALNVVNGILPGTAIDVTSGAAFTYPRVLVVNFDESTGPRVKRDPRGPLWPENMVDGEHIKVEPDFVEVPKAIVEPVVPEDELQEPMSAIKLLHEKMNPIANQHRAMPIIEGADAAGQPQPIVVEDAPSVESVESVDEAANEAPNLEALSLEDEQSSIMPQGGTAPLEPVAPVGQSYSAPLEIGTAVTPIRNSQMQPIMDDPIKAKPSADASAPAPQNQAEMEDSAPSTAAPNDNVNDSVGGNTGDNAEAESMDASGEGATPPIDPAAQDMYDPAAMDDPALSPDVMLETPTFVIEEDPKAMDTPPESGAEQPTPMNAEPIVPQAE